MSLDKVIQPRAVELGKIKIGGLGAEKTSREGGKYRIPEKYDHFKLMTLFRGDDGKLVEDNGLTESLKEYADKDGKLRRLPITFLSNDLTEILQAAYLWYVGKNLGARSDGETVTWFYDPKTNARLAESRSEPWTPELAADKRWKIHTTLNCAIRSAEARWGGVYKLRTTSRITSEQLYGSLLELAADTSGILRGLPFRLVVRPLRVTPEGKPTVVYVVHVELAGGDIKALAIERMRYEVQNMKQIAVLQNEYRQLIAHPDELDPDEAAEIAAEFHSETVQTTGELPPTNGAQQHAPAEQPGTDDEPEDLPPAHPAHDPAAFNLLMEQKGKTWRECIEWINKKCGTAYPTNYPWEQVKSDARQLLVDALRTMRDATLPMGV